MDRRPELDRIAVLSAGLLLAMVTSIVVGVLLSGTM